MNPVHLTLTHGEANLLVQHLAQRLEHMGDELVHTDKHELQRALAQDLQALRALTDRIRRDAGLS